MIVGLTLFKPALRLMAVGKVTEQTVTTTSGVKLVSNQKMMSGRRAMAGELVREIVRSVLETRHLQIPSGLLFTFIPVPAHDTRRIRDVVHHGAPGKELVGLLEDYGPVRHRTQVLSSGEGDDSTIRPDEAGYRLEECGFSAPGRP
jgi:hypothetical protein